MINQGGNHFTVSRSPFTHSKIINSSESTAVTFHAPSAVSSLQLVGTSTENGLRPPPRLYAAPKSSLNIYRESIKASGHMVTAGEESSKGETGSVKGKGEAAPWRAFQDSIRIAAGGNCTNLSQSSHHSSSSSNRRELIRSSSDDSSFQLSSSSWHSSEGSTVSVEPCNGTGTQRPRRGMRRSDYLVKARNPDINENVGEQSGSQFKRLLRTVSWDGHDRPKLFNSGTTSETSASASTQAGEAVWNDEKRILLKSIQKLTQEVDAANSQLKRLSEDPNLLEKLTSQLALAKEEQVALQSQLEIMQGLMKERDQELTALRLESLERHLSTENMTFSTNPRWDRAEDQSSSAAITVNAEEYRSLHSQRDTAMLRAGELAHKLAEAMSQVDDLQERLHSTNVLLENCRAEMIEWKSRCYNLEASIEEVNHKMSPINSAATNTQNSTNGVTTVTHARGIGGMFSRASGTQRSISLESPPASGPAPTATDEIVHVVKSGFTSSTTLTPEVQLPCESTRGSWSPDTQEDVEEKFNANEALAAELWKLKQQVLHLQEEKSACLSALMSSQNELAALANRVNANLPNK